MYEALHSLSTEVTAYSEMSGMQFPLVTMPLFEANAYHARKLSGAEVIAYHPLVNRVDRQAWENFAVQNQNWINSSILIFSGEEGYEFRGEFKNVTIKPDIWYHDEEGSVVQTPLQEPVRFRQKYGMAFL